MSKVPPAGGAQRRGVAQLVARLLWEQDAAGSNPVTPTIGPKAGHRLRIKVVRNLFFYIRT
jgi:hypothetical protein